MTIATKLRRTSTAAAIVLALGAVTTLPAMASHGGGGGVERRGNCTASTDWKLKAKSDDGRIEVEVEIDSNVNGQTWNWKILHNGGVSAQGRATTKAPSGSFEVRRLIINAPGTDSIGLRASNPATGESCSGSLKY